MKPLRNDLRQAYDRQVEARDTRPIQPWKLEQRAGFLARLQREAKRALLEVGAGTGRDSLYFQRGGLQVTCIDLSPENVKMCLDKGLTAHVMDVGHLDFSPVSFDAVYTFNCLLHLPRAELPPALAAIHAVLKPAGLFYLGMYGGYDHEGIWADDTYEPKRFFSFHSDEALLKRIAGLFDVLSFTAIPLEDGDSGLHFQSLLLRKEG